MISRARTFAVFLALETVAASLLMLLLLVRTTEFSNGSLSKVNDRIICYALGSLVLAAFWRVLFRDEGPLPVLTNPFRCFLRDVIRRLPVLLCLLAATNIALGGSITRSLGVALVWMWLRLALLIALRTSAFLWLARFYCRDPLRVVILGTGPLARSVWKDIRTRYFRWVHISGFVDSRVPAETFPEIRNLFLGSVSELETVLLREVVDLIVVAMPVKSCYSFVQATVEAARRCGVEVVQPFVGGSAAPIACGADLLQMSGPIDWKADAQQVLKRLVDVVVAVVLLVLLLPVLLAIGVSIRLTSSGPALFRQQRYGLYRRKFTLFKFRTMVVEAESLMPALEQHNNADGPIFKMKNDPRITPLGRILRKTSLDELPQLWNVLRGDMSLVGPRPMTVRDVSRFTSLHLIRRFTVKPGLTGLWQVSGRSRTTFDHWITMDFHYIDRWSLVLDAKILLRTIPAVLRGSGAM